MFAGLAALYRFIWWHSPSRRGRVLGRRGLRLTDAAKVWHGTGGIPCCTRGRPTSLLPIPSTSVELLGGYEIRCKER